MEQELLRVLEGTQSPDAGPRSAAEQQLAALYTNDAFPVALANIASALSLQIGSRQAALTALKRYVNKCWSSGFEDFTGPPTNDAIKNHLRPLLLTLITDEQRKVRGIAAAIVGKIATSDFPEEWPTLLQDLLKFITEGNDSQTNGALHVLNDVLDEGFGEEQFISVAKVIIEVLYKVATDESRSLSVRSLAVCTFKSCIDTLGYIKGSHAEVNEFAKECVGHWAPFISSVLEAPLPPVGSESVKGFTTLKIQCIRTVMQIRLGLGSVFSLHIERFFASTWTDLNTVKDRYVQEFVHEEAEGRLVDGDALPYSLDLYILEQIDFIQSCLKSKTIRDHLEQAGFAGGNSSPFSQMIFATIDLSQITDEDRSMWEIDLNVFLSEETQISANYTPRTASGDLMLKLGENFPEQSANLLFDHTQRIFASGENSEIKEAVLFLWEQFLTEFAESGKTIEHNMANNLLGFIAAAINSNDEDDQFLRARGYSLAGSLVKCMYTVLAARVPELIEQSIRASTADPSEIVQITSLRAFQKYCDSVPDHVLQPYQASLIGSVRHFLNHKSDDDPEDSQDVLAELTETIRSALSTHYPALLDQNMQIPELLFSIAGHGVTNTHLLGIVHDAFEDTAEMLPGDLFVPLCSRLLPFLTHAMDLDASNNEHPLMSLATDVLSVLTAHGQSPLPDGFVAAVMPRLARILLNSQEPDVVQCGCDALKEVIKHDTGHQLLQWHDQNGKSGLEVTLMIIDRLLRPEYSESSAMEVGGLAAEVVDKFGDQMGQFLPHLLTAVASRLATAGLPPFVQSLILVFARLVTKQAKDVVDFLARIEINGTSGLEIVMKSWMANSSIFTGYDEIRENVVALCHLYNLQDPRLSQIMVQGDLIVPESNRIMTRSKAKKNPDQYTSVSVPVKIIKLLIQELGPNVGESARAFVPSQDQDEEGSDDEGWEDVAEGSGMSGEALRALVGYGRGSRQADDETYAILTAFFKEAHANNTGNFHGVYAQLKPEEQHQLSLLQ